MLSKIEFKSFLIGILSSLCLFMFMGYQSNGDARFNTIYANEIVLDDPNYSQFLYPSGNFYHDKETNMSVDISAFGLSGHYDFAGDNEKLIFDLYIDDNSAGTFYISNEDGNKLITLSKDIDGNGIVQVNNKYGDPGVQLIGSGKTWIKD